MCIMIQQESIPVGCVLPAFVIGGYIPPIHYPHTLSPRYPTPHRCPNPGRNMGPEIPYLLEKEHGTRDTLIPSYPTPRRNMGPEIPYLLEKVMGPEIPYPLER